MRRIPVNMNLNFSFSEFNGMFARVWGFSIEFEQIHECQIIQVYIGTQFFLMSAVNCSVLSHGKRFDLYRDDRRVSLVLTRNEDWVLVSLVSLRQSDAIIANQYIHHHKWDQKSIKPGEVLLYFHCKISRKQSTVYLGMQSWCLSYASFCNFRKHDSTLSNAMSELVRN